MNAIRGLAAIAVALLILPAGCGGSRSGDEPVRSLLPEVRTMVVARDSISRIEDFTGDIHPVKTFYLSPDVAGKIDRIYVDVGDRVRAGQVVARLDTRMAELQVEQAQAALQVARASLNDAERNWERMQALESSGAVSPQQFEKIKLAYESARAQLEQARAGLDLANHNLSVSTVKAPVDGVITARSATEGTVINPMMPGGSGVLTMMDLSTVEVETQAPQEKIGLFRVGQPASVSVSYQPERAFPGTISMVNYAADPSSRMFDIKISLIIPGLLLRAGTFARVRVAVETHRDVPVVPQAALVEEKYVFTLNGNRCHRNEVKVGIRTDNRVEILEGLSGGETAVVEGAFGLPDGAEVRVMEGGGEGG